MNNDKAKKTNDQNQEPQISIEIDNEVIQLPQSKFEEILEREITNYILKDNDPKENIIDSKELVNVEVWKKNFEKFSSEANAYHNIAKQLEKDLRIDKFAQPNRCTLSSFGQNVNVSCKLDM